MSYEGYTQYLCSNGHLRAFDVWNDFMMCDTKDVPGKRCSCGASFVFHHAVDETNGMELDNPGTLPYPFETDVPEKTETCNLGHAHVIEEVRYKIPTLVRG